MDYIDTIIADLDQENISEIMKHGIPNLEDYNELTNIAVDLAKKLNADISIVQLGTKFMHSKLGEAITQKKVHEHTNMALGFALEFFKNYPINDEIKNKVIACIKEHQDKQFTFIESEICANAHCYKYLLPRQMLKMFYNLRQEGYNFDQIFLLVEEKVDEKWNALTLGICKKELENNYKKIKEFLELSRQNKNS